MASRKVVLVTGANGGIGLEIAKGVAREAAAKVLMVGRSDERLEAARERVVDATSNKDIHVELCDLSSKKSIDELVQRVTANHKQLDVLVNNAAIVPDTRIMSDEGIEMQFAVNVVGYYRMMCGFLPLLSQSGAGRIVNVASNYAGDLDMKDLMFDSRPYDANAAYRQSKQCDRMISWAAAAAFEKHNVTVNACHPGVVTTTLLRNLGMSQGWDSAEQGAATPLFLALSPAVSQTSATYFESSKPKKCGFVGQKRNTQALWELCASFSTE